VTRVCLVRVKLGIVAIQLSDRDSMHGPIPSHTAMKCERALATLNQINMIINYFTTLVIVHSSKEICKSRGAGAQVGPRVAPPVWQHKNCTGL
jgi:hypothetical protein